MTTTNAEVSRRLIHEVWNQRRINVIEELLAPESVGHTELSDVTGCDEFRKFQAEILAAIPDFHLEIESMMADRDEVVFRWQATGHHTGDGLGTKASHRPVSFQGITWHRFQDGKIIEGWNFWSHQQLMQQLGG